MDAVIFRGVHVLHCDNHLLVAVKPPNLPAQADSSGDEDMLTRMKAYIKEAYGKPGNVYLGLVHRLDRPVGGLMAFARTSKAAARLSAQLREHAMRRGYLAVVRGEAKPSARLEDMLDRPDGPAQRAALRYEALGERGGLMLLAVALETGRKHQIRRQLSMAGLPIWGDARYGGGKPGEQIALWGASLSVEHPTTAEQLSFSSAPPKTHPWTEFNNVDSNLNLIK